MKAKHTEGPWAYKKSSTGIREIFDKDDRELAEAHGLCDGIDNAARDREANANAHLIAAAPDLLAACETALKDVMRGELMSQFMLEDVIAKARGGA